MVDSTAMSGERGNRWLKWADRYCGIPLIGVLAFCRLPAKWVRNSQARPHPRKIGILAIGAIGDTVLGSSIVQDIRNTYPDAEINLFTSAANAAVGSLIPGISRQTSLKITRPWQAIAPLRQSHLDLLIDTGPWPRINAVLTALSGAKRTIGFRTPGQHRHYAYDSCIDHLDNRHQLENLRALLTPLQIPAVCMPALQVEAFNTLVELPNGKFVVFHAWPSGFQAHYREWPSSHWIELGRRIAEQGYRVVLSGGPADVSRCRTLTAAMHAGGVQALDLSGKYSLPETFQLLCGAQAVVSVDTGILHVAAALGCFVIGLHGPSTSMRWGGKGASAISIDADCPGCGFLRLGFEYPEKVPDCMAAISPKKVWRALEPALRTASSEGAASPA